MQRSALRPRELARQRSQHALAENGGLDQCARVDADDRCAVVEGVEEVGPGLTRVGLGTVRRPDGGIAPGSKLNVSPLGGVLRMRTHEDSDLAEVVVVPSDCRQPAPDEADLVRCDEGGRADVEDVRLLWCQADPSREFRVVGAGYALEPLVELLRARHSQSITRDTVHLDRLPHLDLVPHDDPVRDDPDEAFAGEIVPAGDAHAAWDPCRASTLQILHLAGGEVDHRRDEHDVGRAIADEGVDPSARRDRTLQGPEGADDAPGQPLARPRLHELDEPEGQPGGYWINGPSRADMGDQLAG